MTVLTPIRRIITCQGTIQLVAALAVLRYREKEQQNTLVKYENYLVIYGLSAPPNQINQFADFIRKMAETVCNWQAIVYVTPEQLKTIAAQLDSSRPSTIFNTVYQLIGTSTADEIYLSRNWQFENKLLINAFSSAQKICYGDGIGIYFSSTSPAFFSATPQTDAPPKQSSILTTLYSWKAKIGASFRRLRLRLKLITTLKTIEFDKGYFTLPDVFGEVPPMPPIVLNREFPLAVFQGLKELIDPRYISQFREKIAGHSIFILLTSNLSEAGRISEASEITAYRQFLLEIGVDQNTILVIKPHPRDDNTKIQKLKENLDDLFSDILVLSEPDLFFLPFEIFFIEAFLSSDLLLENSIKVFAVSSACLTLKLLFDVPTHVGFGEKITQHLFNQDYMLGRLAHEKDLRLALQNVNNYQIATNKTS